MGAQSEILFGDYYVHSLIHINYDCETSLKSCVDKSCVEKIKSMLWKVESKLNL